MRVKRHRAFLASAFRRFLSHANATRAATRPRANSALSEDARRANESIGRERAESSRRLLMKCGMPSKWARSERRTVIMRGLVYGNVQNKSARFLALHRARRESRARERPKPSASALRLCNNEFQRSPITLVVEKWRGKSNMRRRKRDGILRPERITLKARATTHSSREYRHPTLSLS